MTSNEERTPSDRPVVSIVVISRNEGEELARTIESIHANTRVPYELIVVDDGSTDGSTDFVRENTDWRLVRTRDQGVAKARNLGARLASADVVVFADAHIRAPEFWHEPVLDAVMLPDVAAVAPGIYSLEEPRRRGFGLATVGPDLHHRWLRKSCDEPYAVPVLPGCFLAMRREVFLETGGFDDGLYQLGGNDVELCLRLWTLGWELRVIPAVEVGHLFRVNTPYHASWVSAVHNRLRTAFVHFNDDRCHRVIEELRSFEAFPEALVRVAQTDIASRRIALMSKRRYDDDWFFRKFDLIC